VGLGVAPEQVLEPRARGDEGDATAGIIGGVSESASSSADRLSSSRPVAAHDPDSARSSPARSALSAVPGNTRSAASYQRAALDGARSEAAWPASRSTATAAASPWRADCST
jgi:hypothetical protein